MSIEFCLAGQARAHQAQPETEPLKRKLCVVGEKYDVQPLSTWLVSKSMMNWKNITYKRNIYVSSSFIRYTVFFSPMSQKL